MRQAITIPNVLPFLISLASALLLVEISCRSQPINYNGGYVLGSIAGQQHVYSTQKSPLDDKLSPLASNLPSYEISVYCLLSVIVVLAFVQIDRIFTQPPKSTHSLITISDETTDIRAKTIETLASDLEAFLEAIPDSNNKKKSITERKGAEVYCSIDPSQLLTHPTRCSLETQSPTVISLTAAQRYYTATPAPQKTLSAQQPINGRVITLTVDADGQAQVIKRLQKLIADCKKIIPTQEIKSPLREHSVLKRTRLSSSDPAEIKKPNTLT